MEFITMDKIEETKFIQRIFETPSDQFSEWFGYYNYDTLNERRNKILCGRAAFDGVRPRQDLMIELGYYDTISREWHKIGETDSWNWQQGAMLQWLHGLEEKVIYNDSNNGRLISRICNCTTGVNKEIDWPIYGITPDGKHSITLDLERSFWCRAYHYASVENCTKDGRVYEDDGIFDIDIENNVRKKIVRIQDVINTDKRDDFDNCKHWLEHIMINPSGTKFCFLHRFSPIHNVYQYTTRLFVANIDGSNLKIIPEWEKYQWSHFGWKGDNAFVIYTVEKPKWSVAKSYRQLLQTRPLSLTTLFKKATVSIATRLPYIIEKHILGGGRYYQCYQLDDYNEVKMNGVIESSLFDIDGHPSFTSDSRYMITDSYPDRHGYQRLIVYDTLTNKGMIIAEFYAYYKGNPASCDLHPKLCSDNEYLAVDTAYDEHHHLILYKLNWEEIKKKLSNGIR